MRDNFSTKLATDKEQAQELIKTGIPADSCDMYIYSDSNRPQVRYGKTANDFDQNVLLYTGIKAPYIAAQKNKSSIIPQTQKFFSFVVEISAKAEINILYGRTP